MTARHDENTQRGLPRFYTLAETARTLRKSERWLWDWLKHHPRDCNGRPFFRLAGRTKLFSLDDVMRLFKALPCPSDYDRASTDQLLRHIESRGFALQWILDTHPHADHFSAAGYLKDVTGAPTAIGERVVEVQKIWKKLYHLPERFRTDGSQWDHLFADGERFAIGDMPVSVMLSPGHTLCSVTYLTGNVAFVHDTLFMPDSGTARADFPGGDARQLWHSIQRILQLPDDTSLFTGHDYRPNGREARWQSTVAEQKAHNAQLKGRDETTFVRFRRGRDRTLPLPDLMLAALQVNIAGGRLPMPEADGRRYLKIPLDAFR